MANIAASDLTYSFSIRDKVFIGRRGFQVRGTITFGDNSLTYGGAGGLALTKGKLGLPRFIRSFKVIGSSTQKYEYEFIPSTEKLILKVLASTTPTGNVAALAVTNSGANAVANAALQVVSNALQHNIANTTITNGAFTGDAIANKAFSELGNVAITTTTIHVEAEGY